MGMGMGMVLSIMYGTWNIMVYGIWYMEHDGIWNMMVLKHDGMSILLVFDSHKGEHWYCM
jgi:hypothetical protein